ncbi:MAG: DNA-protecting protein DprA [Candidatus Niyogibacteria bacterium]|nr:DNA-protecting protein DprA [Candidatus Niyogibacteria bacterium]
MKKPLDKYLLLKLNAKIFPPLLKEIPDPPLQIYLKGRIPDPKKKAVAIVGTRKATGYGLKTARELARDLASQGIIIVSGLALGIDAEAHKGALEAGGLTLAVLGSGINQIYPATNQPLAKKIIDQGGTLISEFEPDHPPEKWTFPQRNRIVAGLCQMTVVVEAPERSGALITAYLALEYNREVGAIPGEITSVNSRGTNELIKKGAALVKNADDVLEVLGLNPKKEKFDKLDKMEKIILECLQKPKNKDELLMETQLPADLLNQKLSLLELKGVISNSEGFINLN